MIRRLRLKFIALSLLSVLLVLCILVGTINLLNYRNILEESDSVLEMLSDYGGKFPDEPKPGAQKPELFAQQQDGQDGFQPAGKTDPDDLEDDFHDDSEKDSYGDRDDDRFDEELEEIFQDIQDRDPAHVSRETPFESRYFTVTLAADGTVQEVNINRIASVDQEAAIRYAQDASAGKDRNGFLDQYRYTEAERAGGTQYLFLDCSRSLGNFRSFLRISVEVAALAFGIVALLIYIFSGLIIRPVAESYEKQRRFITDAGHEIKTPLAIIKADAEVLEMEGAASEWTEDIRLQTSRLTELTNELVYLSRMEEVQRAQTEKADFPFSETLTETARSFESRAVVDGKEYRFTVAPALVCHGNQEAVRKLTGILLDNAFKYSEPGGRIELTASRKGRNLLLSVYNTTPSIAREDTAHLFDRFYRTDRSRNSETGGHGIGLSIAQAIVQAHGGKITAETADERSLRITAVLPA